MHALYRTEKPLENFYVANLREEKVIYSTEMNRR